MDVKPKKTKKKEQLLDPFTKRLLTLMFVTVPVLAYLILKPSEKTQALNIEQTKQFAEFIQTQPELAQRGVASEQHASVPKMKPVNAMPIPVPGSVQQATPFDAASALTLDDRLEINNLASQWNQVDFTRDHVWRDQIETMFSIAERTQSPDVFDLLRRQIILGKVDDDQSNRIRAETWYERYMKVETRPVPRKEMQDLFINATN